MRGCTAEENIQSGVFRWPRITGDGLLTLIFGGGAGRDAGAGMVGLAMVTLGGIELRGRDLMLHRRAEATRWLVGSQLGLLLVILAWCLRNIYLPGNVALDQIPLSVRNAMESMPGTDVVMAEWEGMWAPLMKVVYALVMLISVFYQGTMTMFYLRRVPQALREPPPLPSEAA